VGRFLIAHQRNSAITTLVHAWKYKTEDR